MPSAANPKLEKQASTEAVDNNTPIRQAIVVIEHKIRNLEKRKGKLEGYRDLQKSGKELNADQKVAVAKYDEVINTIEFARELIKSFGVISTASEKEAKKLARKETLQRAQQNIHNIREVLLIQDILSELGADEVRAQFLAGENGAVQLTEDDFTLLDKLYEEITPKRDDAEESFNVLLQRSSEHLLCLIEGKPKEAFGKTYANIRDLLKSISTCEYFTQNKTDAAMVSEEVENADADNVVETDASDSPQPTSESAEGVHQTIPADGITETHEQNMVPIISQQPAVLPPQISMTSRTAVNAEAPAPNAVPAPAFPPPHQQIAPGIQPLPAQVIPQVPPGIVPVVAGQPLPPVPNAVMPHLPTVQSVEHAYFAQQQYIQQQRPLTDVIGSNTGFYFLQESELDSPDVPAATALVPGAPRNTPPPPTGPAQQPGQIPTQTFTNQTFPGVPTIPAVAAPMFPGHPLPPAPTQVPVPELTQQHIPGFTNPNMPIPMPQQTQQVNQQPTSIPQPISTIAQPPQFATQPTAVSAAFPVVPPTQNVPQTVAASPPKPVQLITSQPAPEEEKAPTGDVPEKTDWCEAEPEAVTNLTTNAWHNRQQNQKQNSASHESTQEAGSLDWSNDTAPQESWSGQGDGYRGGFRGRGGRIGNRGGGSFRGRGGNVSSGNNYREQNGGGGASGRPNSGSTYYRNNEQQNNYYQNQNGGGGNYNNRDNQSYQGGYVYRGRGRGAPRGANAPRPGQRTGQASGGGMSSRGTSRGGGNNAQHIQRRENSAATAKQ